MSEMTGNRIPAEVSELQRLAQSGHSATEFQCPLLEVKQTFSGTVAMSAFDPKRTLAI
jgi:hypothetical protein